MASVNEPDVAEAESPAESGDHIGRDGVWPRCRSGVRRLGWKGLVAAVAFVAAVGVGVPVAFGGDGGPRKVTAQSPWLADLSLPHYATPLAAATWGQYVALGDSYSAGVGAYLTAADKSAQNPCVRTSQAYPQLLVKTYQFAKGFAFWACSGAKTGNVERGEYGEPSQLTRLSAATSLVTLSVGGNDSGFADVIQHCVVKLPFTSDCQHQLLGIAQRLTTLRSALTGLYAQIAQRAPNARVLVLGYPRMFSDTTTGTFNVSLGDQRWLNRQGAALDSLIQQVARAEDAKIAAAHGHGSFEYVDAYNAFNGHEIGTSQPWINGLDVHLMSMSVGPQSFHPNALGYQAMAGLMSKQLLAGPGRPILQYR